MGTPNLYFIYHHTPVEDDEYQDFDNFVWAYNARFALAAWRELRELDKDVTPDGVYRVPIQIPTMIGAALALRWSVSRHDADLVVVPYSEWE